jgi:chromosome segregation ATPase
MSKNSKHRRDAKKKNTKKASAPRRDVPLKNLEEKLKKLSDETREANQQVDFIKGQKSAVGVVIEKKVFNRKVKIEILSDDLQSTENEIQTLKNKLKELEIVRDGAMELIMVHESAVSELTAELGQINDMMDSEIDLIVKDKKIIRKTGEIERLKERIDRRKKNVESLHEKKASAMIYDDFFGAGEKDEG